MSESPSSSSTRSGRDGSSSPASGPRSLGAEADGYNEYMTGDEAPEYGAEGLIVLWEALDGYDALLRPNVPVHNFDIVVVHGLHGARRPPWKNPGSGDSRWVDDLGRQNGRKVMSFGYDALSMLSGELTWQSIRRTSIRLLDDLKMERASAAELRPIMFIAHDIGGIIVKDALTYAGLYPSLYGRIFDYTRLLVFYGCPHHAMDRLDMEDRLSRFLLSHFDRNAPRLQGTLAAAKGLTTAVLDINHLFIDSKHVYRSHVISVYNDDDNSQIDKVFDNFAGTLRVPFEMRIGGGISPVKDMEEIEPHLFKIRSQIYPDDSIIEQERTLLSIAGPTAALTTADHEDHPFNWIRENSMYKSWSQQNVPQLLYVHGSSGVRQAAEFAFYDLDNTLYDKENVNEMVLYFTFDRHDIRHDTTEDMLTTFLAQIICHNPSLSEFVVGQFERLAVDRSWSDYDLLTWFEYYRVRGHVDGVSCVINCFEECEPESRKAFLALVTKLSKTHERPWRIIVTSRERGTLSEELKDWPSIDLDTATSSSREAEDKEPANLWMTSASQLFRLRPELKFNQAVQAELIKISELEASLRDLVLAQVSRHSQWPRKVTVESLLGPLTSLSISGIFDRAIESIPEADRDFALRALAWIVCTPRPMTSWELGMALFIGSEGDDGQKARPDYGYVELVITKITDWFAGIIALEAHEIRLAGPRFRELVKDKAKAMPNWGTKFVEAVNKDIVETCLNFLLRPQVRKVLEDVYGKVEEKSGVMVLPSLADRCNFCSYAVLYWLDHLQQIPSNPSLSDVLRNFIESDSVPIWSKAYWALANPITRSPESFPSIYPILTGHGLGDLVGPLHENDEDISAGLVEACLNGFPQVVSSLLVRIQHSELALQHALVAAGSIGDKEVWKLVIQHVRKHHENFDWPVSLLARASWLGLTDIVTELLEVGCDPNPLNTLQGATPLQLAARNGHRDVVKVLLDHEADAKHTADYGRTVIHVATVFGHAEVVELLVKESDAEINARDADNVTAVYVGSLWGNWKVVETLVKLGADPNIGDLEPGIPQWNPLVCAVEEGHIFCVKALLEGGADPNFLGLDGTPLRYAVSAGRIDMVRMLIKNNADLNHEKIDPPILMYAINSPRIENAEARLEMVRLLLNHGAKLDVVDEDGEPPLYRACCLRDGDLMPLVSYLLGRGVDLNGVSRVNGETALHVAVTRRNRKLAELLIEKGANVSPPLGHCRRGSPLHVAIYSTDLMRLLLEHKADLTVKNENVTSVLTAATIANIPETIQLLLDHNAPLEELDPPFDGPTALMFAAQYGYKEAFRLLADAGANINHTFSKGQTILHIAFGEDSLPTCLEYRPPVDVQDEEGNTPLHLIVAWTPLEHIKLLVRAGARLDIQNKKGLTPLSQAIQHAQHEAAEYLLSKSSIDVINSVSDIHGSALHLACSYTELRFVKLLIEKDVDVNRVVSSVAGTPLQSAILCINSFAADNGDTAGGRDDIAAIVDLLISAGADVEAVGGQFGTAVAAAAIRGSATLLRTIIEKGGKPDAPDPMGRLPIHLASVHSPDHFGIILDADGDALVKDKAGRTGLHWAAQGGMVSVVERILDAAGDKVVDQADNDGWTPLCWAARRCGTRFSVPSVDQQLETVKKLIERGAKVDYSLPGQNRRAIDIARYHSADNEVLDLLYIDNKAKPKKNGEEGSEAGESTDAEEKRLFYHHNAYCAYCLTDIMGFLYKCETCADLSLCYKCYESRTAFHPPHHTFEQVGPEFAISRAGSASSSRHTRATGSGASGVDDSEGDDGSDGEDDDDDDEEEEEEDDDDDSDSD